MQDGAAPATRRPTLLTSEDWWAIWLGGLLIAVAVFELVTAVPGVGRWTADPGAAFDLATPDLHAWRHIALALGARAG